MTSINSKNTSMNLHSSDRQFSHQLYEFIFNNISIHQPIIILCIGTDRSTGDSLGPLVGHFLNYKPIHRLHVYGCIDEPVHAKNLSDTIQNIHEKHVNPYIIAIDAALSSPTKIKTVDVELGPLSPGAALKKQDLNPIGDLSIKGYVNVSGFMEFSILQNTRLSTVMKMSKQIAQALYYVDIKLKQHHEQTQVLRI
ncbi:spore protease YyaC [Tenuibacillus multivorans]|uniref:Putative sporulation protein YyaC n=1 Tax=Tenuibacillus multivorans TaxID=237069 RepID=A0A1G9W6W6_9BACI|nr:spore protease YyaC [Tenuibacillus multivorans]GEL76335.1 spore protease YyaC [Tenuibacillus multivorans]SDM80220.1 putative sporulation protein YyaC [Tenuibacillus multivorans]